MGEVAVLSIVELLCWHVRPVITVIPRHGGLISSPPLLSVFLVLCRWVKGSSIGVLFPVLIALLAPLRMLLVKTPMFTERDMEVLDSEG